MEGERSILHCDLNNFYASVECMLHPEIRGYPVAVCGRTEERHGIVLAKNYLAKDYGVKTGESVMEAKSKCRGLVMVNPHYREYMKYSRIVREIYKSYSDLVEPYGMDENWVDVTGSVRWFGSGEKIANEIRERVKRETGLTISVGVSFNKIFAKLGSDMKKPDAVTCITSENFREKIWELPADSMLGVGPSAMKLLRRYGICTIGELAMCPDALLSYKFGINGIRMKQYANGLDKSRVMPQDFCFPVKSVGNGTTFLADLYTNEEVSPMILSLSDHVAARLREAGKKARGISLTVKCNDLSWKEWQTSLDRPTQSAGEIAERAFELFRRSYPWVKPIRAMTVRAIRLVDMEYSDQVTIFCSAGRMEKTESIDRAVDGIRERFGWASICRAATLHMPKMPDFDEEVDIVMPSGMLTVS